MPRDHSEPAHKLFDVIEHRRLGVLFQPNNRLGEQPHNWLRGADMSFFNQQDIDRGGYIVENRCGEKEFHNLTSLSIGALPVHPKVFKSHRDIAVVAAESKKMAKKMHGNSLYCNQRNYSN